MTEILPQYYVMLELKRLREFQIESFRLSWARMKKNQNKKEEEEPREELKKSENLIFVSERLSLLLVRSWILVKIGWTKHFKSPLILLTVIMIIIKTRMMKILVHLFQIFMETLRCHPVVSLMHGHLLVALNVTRIVSITLGHRLLRLRHDNH